MCVIGVPVVIVRTVERFRTKIAPAIKYTSYLFYCFESKMNYNCKAQAKYGKMLYTLSS